MTPENAEQREAAVVEILQSAPAADVPGRGDASDARDQGGDRGGHRGGDRGSDRGGDGGDPRPAVSIVCPFFNEESIIAAATRRTIGNLLADFGPPENGGWELILVDDGSRDASLAKLLAALEADPCPGVRVLTCSVNQGRGRALSNGIAAARGDIIVTTEVDCSWGDHIAARLVEELRRHADADFVVASPHLPGGGLVNVPPRRVLLTRLGNRLIRGFFASDVTMNTGMTRAYRRDVIQPLVAYENGKEFHLEVLLKLRTLGFRLREIPATITWQDHKLAETSSPSQAAPKRKSSTRIVRTINTHLRFIAIAQPVKYFAWLSAFSLVTGLGFVGSAMWMLLRGGPSVFLAIIGLIMLLFCLLFLGFSVLFFQMRESMRESWARSYPGPQPPSARAGVAVATPTRTRGTK